MSDANQAGYFCALAKHRVYNFLNILVVPVSMALWMTRHVQTRSSFFWNEYFPLHMEISILI